jgi:regulation of enolase protein 1 (concanavalin A-like superfamily)
VLDPSDAAHVTLQTAALPETDLMQLVVQNLADLSAAGNVMNPLTNAFRANNFDTLERINNTQAYSASAVGSQVLMTAGGADTWGTADQCAFLYKTLTGNFDYKVQGVALAAAAQWCKMGLMARVSTAPGSRNNLAAFTPAAPGQNTYTPQVRPSLSAASTSSDVAGTPLNLGLQGGVVARPTVVYPSWLRLQRIGDTIYYYYGTNGTNWTFWTYYDSTTSPDGPLPATLQLGLSLSSYSTARTVDGTMASFIAINDGPLYLTLQPTNTTVMEGGTTNFYAAAGGSSPYSYQWLKNATPITDATNATLTLARVPFSDNGALLSCRVSNPYGQVVTSTNATLTVVKDTILPTVRYYVTPKINLNSTEVKLLFSEWMDPTSAQDVANYAITTSPGGVPLAISSATLAADESTVVLTTAAQTPGTLYKVVVNNVLDLACCPPNAVAPNSTDYFFYSGAQPQFTQRADGYVIMEAENAQRLSPSTSAGALEWKLQTIVASYAGVGYLNVTNVRATGGGFTPITGGISQGTGAKMEFDVLFTRPATNYTIWIRGVCAPDGDPTGNNDSHYIGYDGNLVSVGGTANNSEYSQMSGWGSTTVWDWRSDSSAGPDPMVITNVTPGLHTFVIWHREDGACVDKICLEPGVRTGAGNSTEPAPCTSNGGLGDAETWDYIVQPPAAPTITITSPTAGQTFAANATVPITTTVVGPTPIVIVEFFAGTNLLGTATTAPYDLNWLNVPEGLYSLTARVTDGLGYQATSTAVAITVDSTKPVAYAVGSLQGASIGVYFSDTSGLDAVSANTPANYTVNGGAVTVTGATLEPDLRAVMLSLSAPVSGQFSVAIKDVADRGFGPSVMVPVTLQSTVVTWPVNQDVGTTNALPPPLFTDPFMPGFAQAIGTDGFYVHAGGSDIWNAADGMHFVHQRLSGNFDISVRVDGLRLADQWSKAGLMVREDLDGNSRNYVIAATATNGVNQLTTQWRAVKGGASVSVATVTPAPIPNAWLRVTRTNQLFSFYYATNGTTWVSRYTTNLTATPYPAAVYVGLATTSHNNGTNLVNTTGAYFRNLAGLAPSAPPVLGIQLRGNELVITWTTSNAACQLRSTGNLAVPTWQPVGTAPVINGENYTVTLPATGSPQYFRLLLP